MTAMTGYVAGSESQISLNDISAAGFAAFVASVRCDAYERLASKTAAGAPPGGAQLLPDAAPRDRGAHGGAQGRSARQHPEGVHDFYRRIGRRLPVSFAIGATTSSVPIAAAGSYCRLQRTASPCARLYRAGHRTPPRA